MDIQLPGMDGLQASRIIRAEPDTADKPVDALTGFAMQADQQRALEAGCSDVVTKPIDVNRVLSLVEGYCSENGKKGSGVAN